LPRGDHTKHVTAIDRTPRRRMLPSVMGSIGSVELAAIFNALSGGRTDGLIDRSVAAQSGYPRQETLEAARRAMPIA